MILCGSCMGFMEKEVLGLKSPLFGRRTGQLHMKPFSYQTSIKFMDQFSAEEKLMLLWGVWRNPTVFAADWRKGFLQKDIIWYFRSDVSILVQICFYKQDTDWDRCEWGSLVKTDQTGLQPLYEGNRQSALMLGINVKRTRFMAHLICCLLAGIGGYVYFLHVGSGAASHASGITIVAMLCIFLVVQSVIIARKKKAEA